MENQKHEKSFSHPPKHFNKSRKGTIIFWSIVLVVVSFFFLKNSGLIASCYFSAFLTWPIILFCIAIICFLKKEWVTGIVLLAGATFFWTPIFYKADPNLIPCLNLDGVTSQEFIFSYWYLLIIFIAIVIIFHQIFAKESRWENKCKWKKSESNVHEIKDGFIRSDVVFSSNERIYLNENFKGGKFSTVFGSQEIDLRKCVIPNNGKAHIEISTVFGSCMIWVPTDWTVQVNTESVFSSVEDKRLQTPPDAEGDMLIIDGKSVFSSIEIRS
jgi:predicted membrane protein